MRPLSLEISGLRSYRSRTLIEFPDDGGLIGVIGDTGSGKSSILEAMVAGLYGRTSWKRGDLSDLRNSSESTMRIVFTFEVDGTRWRVTRTSSRNNYPPSVHELECLDDADESYDGRTEVTDKVVELIGLDYDAFKSAVILPQGNFERLLKASEADRIEILMGILRLNQLHEVREQAVETQLGLTKLLGSADRVRSGFGNPLKEALDAAEERSCAVTRRDALRQVSKEIGSLNHLRAGASDQLARLTAVAADADHDGTTFGASAGLRTLAARQMTMQSERKQLLERLTCQQSTADQLRHQLVQAAAAGESVEQLAAARGVLESRVHDLPVFDELGSTLEVRAAELALRKTELIGLRQAWDAARIDAQQAQQLAVASAAGCQACTETVTAASNAVNRWRQSAGALTIAEQAVSAASEKLVPAQTTARDAIGALARAREAEERAATELMEAHRADHAASAALGLASGDLCPVCSRTLPADFAAPEPSETVAAAINRETASREAMRQAIAAESRANMTVDSVEAEIAGAEIQRVAARERAAADRAAVNAYTQGDVHVEDSTDVILKALFDERTRLSAEGERTAAAARDAAAASHSCETTVLLAEQKISIEDAAIARDRQTLASQRAVSEAAREALPPAFRPEVADCGDVVGAVLERVLQRLRELSGMAAARDKAVAAAAAASRALATLSEQQRIEIDEPHHALLRGLGTLAVRAAAAAELLNVPGPMPLDEQLPLEALADAAEQLERDAATQRVALRQAMLACQQRIEEAGTRTRQALAEMGLETHEQLQSELELAAGEVLRWDAAEQRARDLIEPACQLDRAIAPVRERVTALEEVGTLLRRDAFVKDVCERRQQALLGHASRILLTMTNQRYGFDRKFAIADTLTGVPRKVDTLSGGETFLASLALALGLVEVARLGGGRLDAIFLDEGFGSLDQAALDQAITALDSVAVQGRAVAVVTHVRRVMDNIERILAVTRGPEGSRAVWLDSKERENLVEQDVAAGLLA